jgi:hypothetical protein
MITDPDMTKSQRRRLIKGMKKPKHDDVIYIKKKELATQKVGIQTEGRLNRKGRRLVRRQLREHSKKYGSLETDAPAAYTEDLKSRYLDEQLLVAFTTGAYYRIGRTSVFIKGIDETESVNRPPSGEGPKPSNGEGTQQIQRIHKLVDLVVRHETLRTLKSRRGKAKIALKGKQERNDKRKTLKTGDQLTTDMRKCQGKIREVVERLTQHRYTKEGAYAWCLFFSTVRPGTEDIVGWSSFLQHLLFQSLCLAFGEVVASGRIEDQPEFVVSAVREQQDLQDILAWKQGGRDRFMMRRIDKLPEYLREWEKKNYYLLKDHLVTDGSSIRYVGKVQPIHVNDMKIEDTVGRTFNSGSSDEFRFKFEGEDDWDENDYKIKDVKQFLRIAGDEAEKWKRLRPACATSWVCAYVYFSLLKRSSPAAYNFARRCGFMTESRNIDNYQKQCKLFTAFLKENKDYIEKTHGFSVTLLFELEQLTGFRTRHIIPDWVENIEEWVSFKDNMNTPLAAYYAFEELNKQLDTKTWDTQELEERLLATASVFNADGSAKGERLQMGRLHLEEDFVPKMVRLNKTSFNMLQTPKERTKMVFSSRTMYGYPVQKKEITKVRYIINTDVVSHYALAPLESMLASSLKNSDVFNMMNTDDQRKREISWLFSKKKKLCADQSSFDHYCCKASFYQLFGFMADRLTGRLRELCLLIKTKLSASACFIVSQDEVSRWWSGMLSGWKITSIGDSLINLTQMKYAISATGSHLYEISVQGDDVNAESDTISAAKVTTVMNGMGLKQHPDKTISSERYSEFLRVLSDSFTHERAGYPTRLVPAMIFLKPWSAQYSSKEWSGDSIVQRLKSWRTLAHRMRMHFSDPVMLDMCVADCYRSARLRLSREAFRSIIKNDVLQIALAQSRYEKEASSIEKGKMFVLEGRVDKKTLRALIATNLSTQGKMQIADLRGVPDGTKLINRFKKPITIMKAPLPQTWLKREIRTQTDKEIVKFNMLWGRAWAKKTGNYQMWLANSEVFVHLLRNELAYGSEYTFVLPVSDQTVTPVLNTIKAEVQFAKTAKELEQRIYDSMSQVNWVQTQRALYRDAKLFV